MSDLLIGVDLALPEIKPHTDFAQHTSLLSAAHAFASHAPLAFLAAHLKKEPTHGGFFRNVTPEDGKLTLELGLVLPDTLPDIEDLSECILTVKDAKQMEHTLCLSNRMSRFRFFDSGRAWECLAPRSGTHSGSVEIRRDGGQTVPASEELLRTAAAIRFEVIGETAEEAVERSIRASIDALFVCVNATLDAARATGSGLRPIARSLGWHSVASIYALVSNHAVESASLVALSSGRVVLRPSALRNEDAARFRKFAAGILTLTDVDRLLGEAHSSWQCGEYELAFLQAVIAAEIETGRTIRAECGRRGVSKARLNDSRRDLTYSWALNIGLPLAFDKSVRPPDALVAEMNLARQRRNALMHEAEFSMTSGEVNVLIKRTKDYIDALREAAAKTASSTGS